MFVMYPTIKMGGMVSGPLAGIMLIGVLAILVWLHVKRLENMEWHRGLSALSIFYPLSILFSLYLMCSDGKGNQHGKPANLAKRYPGGRSATPAQATALVLPSPEEVEVRSGIILTEQEKRVIRAVTQGMSIEAAATEAGTTTAAAKVIYGAFYAAYGKRPENERQAYLETALDTATAGTKQHGNVQTDAMPTIEFIFP